MTELEITLRVAAGVYITTVILIIVAMSTPKLRGTYAAHQVLMTLGLILVLLFFRIMYTPP